MYDCWLSTIQSACNAGDTGDAGSLSGSGRPPREVATTQYSCLENSLDRGAWWATKSSRGRKESDTTEGLSMHISDTCMTAVRTLQILPQLSSKLPGK